MSAIQDITELEELIKVAISKMQLVRNRVMREQRQENGAASLLG